MIRVDSYPEDDQERFTYRQDVQRLAGFFAGQEKDQTQPREDQHSHDVCENDKRKRTGQPNAFPSICSIRIIAGHAGNLEYI